MNPTLLPSPMGKIATNCSTIVINGRPGGENHKVHTVRIPAVNSLSNPCC